MVDSNTTFDEMWAEVQKIKTANPNISHEDLNLPMFQWYALNEIKKCKITYDSGNKFSLMYAIKLCAEHKVAMPEWVAEKYIEAIQTLEAGRETSYDKVFALPYPKGKHVKNIHERTITRMKVWGCVRQTKIDNPNIAIDIGLFEQVGEMFGIGATLVSKYYYKTKEELEP